MNEYSSWVSGLNKYAPKLFAYVLCWAGVFKCLIKK